MPGGFKKLTGEDGKKFSAEYQPKNRRKSSKFLTDLLIKSLDGKKEIIMTGTDVETGQKRKFKVFNPTKDIIVMALLQKAAKGDISAIREILDRVEGKPVFTAEVNLPGVQHIGFSGE
jgi:hypothetical protein